MTLTFRHHTERRRFPRHPAPTLMARIDGKDYLVQDISLEGMRLADCRPGRTTVEVLLHRGSDTPVEDRISLTAHIVEQTDDHCAFGFERSDLGLLKLVCTQVSINLGNDPSPLA
jgi:hypothetical protein